ncbi:hypothetical protein TNCV_1033171 [Trichonephila clavipes]|nr:hypothetical protein TNCV_1033171 [Trichonephila clavipes]
MYHHVISLGRVQLKRQPRSKRSKAAHHKNPTTVLSSGIKANHPRLRDGCSDHRVRSRQYIVYIAKYSSNNNPKQINVHDLQSHKLARQTAAF